MEFRFQKSNSKPVIDSTRQNNPLGISLSKPVANSSRQDNPLGISLQTRSHLKHRQPVFDHLKHRQSFDKNKLVGSNPPSHDAVSAIVNQTSPKDPKSSLKKVKINKVPILNMPDQLKFRNQIYFPQK